MNRCVFFLLLPFVFCAQKKTLQEYEALYKKAGHDTVRVRLLFQIASDENDPSKKSFYTDSLLRFSVRKLKDDPSLKGIYTRFEAGAYHLRGMLAFLKGDLRNAETETLKGLGLRKSVGHKPGIANSLANLGNIYYSMGDPGRALDHYKKSLVIFEQTGPKQAIALIRQSMGLVYHLTGDLENAEREYMECFRVCEELGYDYGLANAASNMGRLLEEKHRYADAIRFHLQSMNLNKKTGNEKGVGIAYENLGVVYYKQGNIQKAIEYFTTALKMAEKNGAELEASSILVSLGNIYQDQKDLQKADEYFRRALGICRKTGNKTGEAAAIGSTGQIQLQEGKLQEALRSFREAAGISKQIGDIHNLSATCIQLASAHKLLNAPDSALHYYEESIRQCTEIHDQAGMSAGLTGSGEILFEKGKAGEAMQRVKRAYLYAKASGYTDRIVAASELMWKINKKAANFHEALKFYEEHIKMRDSIHNEVNRKASIKSQLKYEYEKQATADSVAHAKENEIKSAELSRQSAELRAKKNQQYALFGGLALVMVFAGLMYNRFKVTQKQKIVIEHQKETVEEQKKLVEEKQKEILDSIHYARRIQLAQIPSEKRISFILKKMQPRG